MEILQSCTQPSMCRHSNDSGRFFFINRSATCSVTSCPLHHCPCPSMPHFVYQCVVSLSRQTSLPLARVGELNFVVCVNMAVLMCGLTKHKYVFCGEKVMLMSSNGSLRMHQHRPAFCFECDTSSGMEFWCDPSSFSSLILWRAGHVWTYPATLSIFLVCIGDCSAVMRVIHRLLG